MADAGAPDSSNVDKLNLLTKYRTELLKPCESTEKLLGTLDKLEHLLSSTPRDDRKLVDMSLQMSKEVLISNELMKHSELDVRVSVASCISQIIRIVAPNEPYGEDHMKEFFELAVSAFMRLCCMSGRAYSKAVCILHTMSFTESCVMMLDLELYASVDHMFHLFLDGIRNKHPNDVFSSMEKIMTMIIRDNVDYDEFSLVLVRILLNRLRRVNKNVSPVSFQLAENTFKNCSAVLKKYLPEALECSDFPIDDYAEVVVSCFQDEAQRETTGGKDTVENVASPGKAGLAIEADLCDLLEANETQNPKIDENHNENQTKISHCSDDPDEVGKSMNMQQKQKPEEVYIRRKRNRRPNSLKKAEEGYDPNWMWIDWRSTKGLYKKKKYNDCTTKTQKSKGSLPKPAGENIGDCISTKPSKEDSETNEEVSANKALEPKSEGKIVSLELEDETGDFLVKSCSDKGQGSTTKIASVKKSGKETTVSEDLKDDAVVVTSGSQCRPISSQAKALSTEVSKQNPKGSVAHLKKRTARGPYGEEMIGCRIKVWWPLDKKFYKATIVAYDSTVNYHKVDYDDGDVELLELSSEHWELLWSSKLPARAQRIRGSSSSSKAS